MKPPYLLIDRLHTVGPKVEPKQALNPGPDPRNSFTKEMMISTDDSFFLKRNRRYSKSHNNNNSVLEWAPRASGGVKSREAPSPETGPELLT